jgi:hypothetical protein
MPTQKTIYKVSSGEARWGAGSPASCWSIPMFRADSYVSPQKSSNIRFLHTLGEVRLVREREELSGEVTKRRYF